MTLAAVTLDDKYVQEQGRIYLSGIQALVRLPLLQQQRDKAAGLTTGGFISGYRGSPLGVYDNALWQARRFLERAQHPLPARAQRGSGRDLGLGQPADHALPRRHRRWRLRHLVRQGPRRRPLDRRAQARQCRRHRAPRRRARDRRRRSRLPVLDARASERADLHRRDDADPQSGDGAGISRLRSPRLRALALFRLLGGLQGDRGDGGELGLRRHRSRTVSRS